MEPWVDELKKTINGEILTSAAARHRVSHDASIYELIPDVIVRPKHVHDIEMLVRTINKHKSLYPKLAVTARGAGTDTSGGPLGTSIIVEMAPYFSTIHSLSDNILHAQPGAYLRDIDTVLAEKGLHLGCAPSSRNWCTIGGVVANNAGGGHSVRYGNAQQAVKELSVVLADGNAHNFRPLTKRQLDKKLSGNDYEASLYKKVYDIIESNYDVIKNSRPKVSKNTMGYNLWSVWDRNTGIFDMTQLFSGSQGTLGIITDIHMQVETKATHSSQLLIYVSSLKKLTHIIQTVNDHHPAAFEGFEEIPLGTGARRTASVTTLRRRTPHLFLLVDIDGSSQRQVTGKLNALRDDLALHRVHTEIFTTNKSTKQTRQLRRASRSHLRHQAAASVSLPYINDIAVEPRFIASFIPELRTIIRRHKLPVAIQGHFGDGNFHIVPIVAPKLVSHHRKFEAALRDILPLIQKYGGTLAGEHNDGLMRGPWLPALFGTDMYQLFKEIKEIFDPQYIFNPHKKTDASWDYSMSHVRTNPGTRLIK